MKKRILIAAAILAAVAVCTVILLNTSSLPSEKAAEQRIKEFTELVDYQYETPEKIYAYLTEDYRNSISKEDFVKAFNKERTYPYLTSFFINLDHIKMDDDNKGGVAVYSQAARLPGMVYEMPFVYENGNYYMIMEEYAGFPDGSYLDKFDHIPTYLTQGWG